MGSMEGTRGPGMLGECMPPWHSFMTRILCMPIHDSVSGPCMLTACLLILSSPHPTHHGLALPRLLPPPRHPPPHPQDQLPLPASEDYSEVGSGFELGCLGPAPGLITSPDLNTNPNPIPGILCRASRMPAVLMHLWELVACTFTVFSPNVQGVPNVVSNINGNFDLNEVLGFPRQGASSMGPLLRACG